MKRKEGTSSSDPQSDMPKAANLPPVPNAYTGRVKICKEEVNYLWDVEIHLAR